MFHKRHQRVNRITFREHLRLTNALDAFQPGLSETSQDACERFVQRALLHLRPQEEQPFLDTWKVTYPESHDRVLLETAVKALETAHARKPATVFAYKLSECYMFLERFDDAIRVLEDAIEKTPGDARLFYALATMYRILGRLGPDEAMRISWPLGIAAVATPAIETLRSRLGLTAQDALRLAQKQFSRVLAMNIHPSERALVEMDVTTVKEMLSEVEAIRAAKQH